MCAVNKRNVATYLCPSTNLLLIVCGAQFKAGCRPVGSGIGDIRLFRNLNFMVSNIMGFFWVPAQHRKEVGSIARDNTSLYFVYFELHFNLRCQRILHS